MRLKSKISAKSLIIQRKFQGFVGPLGLQKRIANNKLSWPFLTVWKGKFWQIEKGNFDSLKREILTDLKEKFWQFKKENFDSLKRNILTVWKGKFLTVWKGKFWQFENENGQSDQLPHQKTPSEKNQSIKTDLQINRDERHNMFQ